MTTKFKISAFLGVTAVMGLIAAYALEFQWIENTFEVKKLVWLSVFIGLAVGVLIAFRLQKSAEDSVARMQIWAACLILCALFAPLVGSLINRLFSIRAAPQTFLFFDERPYASSRFGWIEGEKISPDGYYIFITRNGKLERIESKKPRFEGVERGAEVELPVRKGLLGFDVVQFSD